MTTTSSVRTLAVQFAAISAQNGQKCRDGAGPPPLKGMPTARVSECVQPEQGSQAPQDDRQHRKRDWAAAD